MGITRVAVALAVVAAATVAPTLAEEKKVEVSNPVVEMKTSKGTIKIELWKDKAPVTVKNFLRYVDEQFYDGTMFHRVIASFMIQGGGFTLDMKKKKTHSSIKNEARSDVKNVRGTIAMARTNVVDSATAQFFINVADNKSLDHKDETTMGFGYAVFGKVIEGMDVVDEIRNVKTTTKEFHRNVPAEAVEIESIKRWEKKEEKKEKRER